MTAAAVTTEEAVRTMSADAFSTGSGSGHVPRRSLTFIGTATMLLRLGEFTVLTDPNFLHRGQRAYLGWGLTSQRLTEPALDITELPALDAVVLSHLHGDHWDRVARRGIDHGTPVITTPHAARHLRWQGFTASVGLQTWSEHSVSRSGERLSVTATPGRHAPRLAQRLLPPVMGSVLHHRSSDGNDGNDLYIYLTGDTLLIAELREVPRRFPQLDVMAMHLGGTRLPGGLKVTMDAEDGADLMGLLTTPQAVPIHNDDYPVFKSPLSAFRQAVVARGLERRVTYAEPGRPLDLDRIGADDDTARG